MRQKRCEKDAIRVEWISRWRDGAYGARRFLRHLRSPARGIPATSRELTVVRVTPVMAVAARRPARV